MSTWIETLDANRLALSCQRLRESAEGRAALAAANDNEHFALWLVLADAALFAHCGFHRGDISHWSWESAYQSGISPTEAANRALYEGGVKWR